MGYRKQSGESSAFWGGLLGLGTRQLCPAFAGGRLTGRAGLLRAALRKAPGSEPASGGTFADALTAPETQVGGRHTVRGPRSLPGTRRRKHRAPGQQENRGSASLKRRRRVAM